ncbi:hypothetical protein D9M70_648060 [compost metagenome]
MRERGLPDSTRSGKGAPSSGSTSVSSKSTSRLITSDLGKCLFDISDDVIRIFDTDREANHFWTGTGGSLLFVGQLTMGR